ncbi:MAG TPA: hypothetical protein ENO22_08960 [candidate division Zixibacteria bacterium]|nr:hypothetical protein [candidate division Zixibacteria bacterium]
MKRMAFILCIIIILAKSLNAGCLFNSFCPQQSALGNTCLGRYNNSSVIYVNPALLKLVERTSVAFDYQMLYGLSELDLINLSLSHDFGVMYTGLAYSNFGQPDIMVENRFALVFSKDVYQYFTLGLRWEHYRISFAEDFDDLGMNSISLGMAAQIDDVVFHTVLSNINSPRMVESQDKVDLEYRFGLCLRNLEYLVLNLELSGKGDIRRYHFGQEIMLEEIFFIRLGLITNPTMPSGGFGIKWNQFQIDYAINRHNQLGETHSFGFALNL